MKATNSKPAAPKRNRRNPEAPGRVDRTSSMLIERNKLCAEAREHPDSEAFEIVRAYVLTGIRASRQSPDVEAENSELPGAESDAQIREKLSRVARAAEEAVGAKETRPLEVYNKICHILGFDRPLVPIGPQAGPVESGAKDSKA